MPPEQICDAEVGPPADVYALGCVLYELLVGEPPFSGDRAQLLAGHLYSAPPPVRDRAPWAPPEVEVLIEQMLGKSPGRRPTMAMVAEQCRTIGSFRVERLDGERPESRSSRAVTLHPPRAARTPAPTEAGTRRVLVVPAGKTDAELAIALAANDIELTSDPAAPRDVVLALDLPEADLAAWLAGDTPVLASAPSGDLDRAMQLVQQGAADVVTTPIRGDMVARKLLRILRERARRTR